MLDGFGEKTKKIVSAPVIKIIAGLIVVATILLVCLLVVGRPLASKFTGFPPEAKEKLKKEITQTQKRFPIAKVLPYGGAFNKKTFFVHAPRQDGTILVEYDKGQDENKIKDEVFYWVRYQGYKPNDYNFVFKVRDFQIPK